jgi:hypothetical protein
MRWAFEKSGEKMNLNPFERQHISAEQRRQLMMLHLQGFNHQPMIEDYRKQQEAAFIQRINAYVVELLQNQQEIQQLASDLLASVQALNALPMLQERNALLQTSNTQLKEVQQGLLDRTQAVKEDLATKHQQRALLIENINQMNAKLSSVIGRQYAAQSAIETGSMIVNTLVAKVSTQQKLGR